MSKLLFSVLLSAIFAAAISAQAPAAASAASATPPNASAEKPNAKRGPVFRATKAQIKEAQAMLKDKKLYAGEATGTLDDATRASLKTFQGDNGLKKTGTLNRATLEAMKIALTDSQKAIPASASSYASAEKSSETGTKPKRIIFRASKDQISEAQKLMKAKGMYSGDETGKLDDATRESLKKYQAANDLKVTGTLNQATIEKMGIALTDKQKEAGAK